MKYFSVLLLFQIQLLCYGQATVDSAKISPTTAYLKSYWDNGLQLVTQPVRWKAKDWMIFGGSLGVTTGLVFIDEDLNKPFKKWNERNVSYGKTGSFIGSTPVMIGSTLVTLAVSSVIKNPAVQNFALDNLQAQIFTGAFTYATKKVFGRARPDVGLGAHYWDGPFKPDDYESFFSGHSSLAFSTATMIFLHSRKKLWVGFLSYGTATAIAISRMQYQKHWASDILMGAVCGWAVASFVYHRNERKRNVKKYKCEM